MSEIFVPGWWRDRLEQLGGGRRESLTIAVIVGILVFGGLGVWARGAPASIAPPARATVSPAPSVATPGMLVIVHVAGAVVEPGVYELPTGARIADAIALAGGATARADLDALNLAAIIEDGSQVLVPRRGAGVPGAPGPIASPAGPALVDLNTADQVALESVPGLGPVKAAAILQLRAEIGSFTSIEELLDVAGIGPATLESIRPYVTI